MSDEIYYVLEKLTIVGEDPVTFEEIWDWVELPNSRSLKPYLGINREGKWRQVKVCITRMVLE